MSRPDEANFICAAYDSFEDRTVMHAIRYNLTAKCLPDDLPADAQKRAEEWALKAGYRAASVMRYG